MNLTKEQRDLMRALGRRGGRARAQRHSKATLRKWGKKGGRPRKGSKPKERK